MREPAVALGAAVPRVKPRRRKEVRDPYDGLRPWSAITHGIGAGLAVIGTLPGRPSPTASARGWR